MLNNCAENRPLRIVALTMLCLMALVSCECSSSRQQPEPQEPRQSLRDNIQAQKDFLEKERNSIEAYIEDRELKMERTGTGLYYQLMEDSTAEMMVASEDVVDFEYEIYLMNGTLIYSSAEDGVRRLKVDKEQAELGLHESLKLLGLGDKGRFILPSHLAFGVGGDQNRVPPKTPLVYEIRILNINKSKS